MLNVNRQRLAFAVLLLLTGVLCSTPSYAQALLWENSYGGEFNESGYAGVRTSDGGFAVLGSTYSYGEGDHDFYLVRLDSLGDTVWTNTFGGPNTDYGYDLQQTADGGFILVGVTNSSGAGGRDVMLVKVNSSGVESWSETYGGEGDDIGWSVCTVTGGYVITGSTTSYGAGVTDVYLIRTDNIGDTVWTRTYGGANGESGHSIKAVPEGGCIVAGATGSFGEGYSSVYALRIDDNGDTLWTTTYGGPRADAGYSVEVALDGGFVFAGSTAPVGAGYNDVYLVKTDPDGVLEWEQNYGGAAEDRAYSVKPAADGGYLIGGTTESYGAGKVDMFAIKTNPIGGVDWDTTYGGSSSDFCRAVVTDQYAWFFVGYSFSISSGGSDLYLVKVHGDQATPVEEDPDLLLPSDYTVAQNYPNPFNAGTNIQLSLERRATVDLQIFNILGQIVYDYRPGNLSAGLYDIHWDGTDTYGRKLASGVYLYRLTIHIDHSPPIAETRKMVMLK